jgi:formyltetrahydrofolate deformylase
VLHGHGGNIVASDQHTDPIAGQFFQRIRVDLTELHTDRTSLEGAVNEVAERFGMTWRMTVPEEPKRVALFVSKYDHCLWDLMLRHRAGELRCQFTAIVSNHPDLEPIARQFDVPYHVFPITKDTKSEQEAKERALLDGLDVDLIVLARYMQVLSGDFIDAYPNRIINIHHSFLPAFIGANPYRQAHERGVKLIGATAHYATAELDEGPIIAQDTAHVSHRETVAQLTSRGRDLETVVLARAVAAHLEHRVAVHGHRTIVYN